MHEWLAKYIGLEFQDHGRGPRFDCWGLVREILKNHYGVLAPDFGDLYTGANDRSSVPSAFNDGPANDWVKVESGQEGDVVIIKIGGKPMHCGLVVGPSTMLHARPVTGSVLENYDRPQWNRRIEGFYRHCSRI